MALWHRIGPTRLGCLSHRCRKWCSILDGAAGGLAAGRADGRRVSGALEIPLSSPTARPGSSFGLTPVRSFAAPVQAKPKPKPSEDSESGPRINEAITAAVIRLVTDDGHSVVSRREALDRARKLNLDLVEVQRTANPPVCKIMDFHREKFQKEEKEKERAKSKSALSLRSGESKEVRFKAKTDLKDLKIKAETVTRLMERGYRVKCTALPTGNEEEDLGGLLARLLALLEEVSVVESGPHVDIRQAYVILRHVKFVTKRSGKKISNVMEIVSRLVQGAIPNATAVEEEQEPIECGSESHATDAHEDISDIDSEVSGIPASKPRLGSLKAKLEIKKEPTNVVITPRTKKTEPSVAGGNRYSKPSEPNERFQQPRSRERSSTVPEARNGNVSDWRGQLDPKQRQIRPNYPNSPSPSYRIVNPPKTAVSSDQSKVGGAATSKSSERSLPSQSYGNFSASKITAVVDQKNSGDATTGKPSDRSLPSRSYGIFSTSKTSAPGNEGSSGNANTGTPSNPSSPPAYGIFSTTKPAASGDQRILGGANSDKAGKVSP